MAGQADHPGTFTKTDPDNYRVDTRFNAVDITAQPRVSGMNVVNVTPGHGFEAEEHPKYGSGLRAASRALGRDRYRE